MKKDDTIDFIPERLNRQPVVFRGMTISELIVVFSVGALFGLAIGILLAIVIGEWAVIPTAILFCAFLCVLTGGNMIARLKRGKPDTWLVRFLELKFGKNRLLLPSLPQTQYWSTRRGRK